MRTVCFILALFAVAPVLSADITAVKAALTKMVDVYDQQAFNPEAKHHVVVMMGVHCPIARLYLPRLIAYQNEYKSKGVQFYFVFSNLNEEKNDILAIANGSRTEGKKIPIPFIHDSTQAIADTLGARTLSQTFLYNQGFEALYQGMIDDQYTISTQKTATRRPEPEHQYLLEAIQASMNGMAIRTPATVTQGCVLQRKKEPTSHELTYNRDIAPIFRRKCETCHREGEVKEDVPLNAYDEVESYLDTIAERVSNRVMPPWSADPNIGKFKNDISLSNEQLSKIIRWIEIGAPEGEGTPPPPLKVVQRKSPWKLGNPDAVYAMEKSFDIPAEGYLDYVYLENNVEIINPEANERIRRYQTATFKEDKFLHWSQVIPDARAVVHHVIVYILRPETDRRKREDISLIAQEMEDTALQRYLIKRRYKIHGENLRFMNEFYGVNGNRISWELGRYVPGADLTVYNEEYGVRVPKGSKLVFEMHYTPNGTPATDRTLIGVKWTDKAPKHLVHTLPLGHLHKISIPAFDEEEPEVASNYELSRNHTFDRDVTLLWLRPHGHLRAKSFRYEIDWPKNHPKKGGTTEVILSVPSYDFNNQPYYEFSTPLKVPQGTTLRLIGHYDNSPSNPNLTEELYLSKVRFGLQTEQEMFFGYVAVAEDATAELKPSTIENVPSQPKEILE